MRLFHLLGSPTVMLLAVLSLDLCRSGIVSSAASAAARKTYWVLFGVALSFVMQSIVCSFLTGQTSVLYLAVVASAALLGAYLDLHDVRARKSRELS